MAKKCIVCGDKAEYFIQDSSEYYCRECAEEHFGDLGLLREIGEADEDAKKIKNLVESREEE